MFLDIDNISLSHFKCNSGASQAYKGLLGEQYGYVGTSVYKSRGLMYFRCKTCINGKKTTLGYFKSPHHAAIAYDIGIFRSRDGKAKLNFEELRSYYIRLLSKFPPESQETIFYKRGPIKGLVKRAILDNKEYFQSKNLDVNEILKNL